MTKSVSPALTDHLAQDVTTLCSCWRIARRDEVVMGFTDLDQDLELDGLVYRSSSGFRRSAIENTATTSDDTLELTGFVEEGYIQERDLRSGRYDYAEVEVFLVNYEDLGQGKLNLRTGYFGEAQITPSGLYTVELRGLMAQLSQHIGEVFTKECRANLFDERCKVKRRADVWHTETAYRIGDRVRVPLTTFEHKAGVGLPLINPGFDIVYVPVSSVMTTPGINLPTTEVSVPNWDAQGLMATNQALDIEGSDTTFVAVDPAGGWTDPTRYWGERRYPGWFQPTVMDFIVDMDLPVGISKVGQSVTVTVFVRGKDRDDVVHYEKTETSTVSGIGWHSVSISADFSSYPYNAFTSRQKMLTLEYGFTYTVNDPRVIDPVRGQHQGAHFGGPSVSITRPSIIGDPLSPNEVLKVDVQPTNFDAYYFGELLNNQTPGWNEGLNANFWGNALVDSRDYPVPTGQKVYGQGWGYDQDVDLTQLPLDPGTQADGRYELRLSPLVNRLRAGANPRIRVRQYDLNGALVSDIDHELEALALGVWTRVEHSVPLHPATTLLNIDIGTHTIELSGGYADMQAVLVDGELGRSLDTEYLDVEFECVAPGTSSATVAPFQNAVLGDQIVDGDVTWLAVRAFYYSREQVGQQVSIDTVLLPGLDADPQMMRFGTVNAFGGDNHLFSREIAGWDNDTKEVRLKLPFPYAFTPGDTVTVEAGCDKTRGVCSMIYNNIENFRGEPDIPGTGHYFRVGGK